MNNNDYINAYKGEERIIADYYKLVQNGKTVDVTGIVNPLKIDNRQMVSPMDDQKNSPHCAGYSAATIVETLYWRRTGRVLQLDSHQVYALAKMLDGDVRTDGTYLEAALKAVLELCGGDDRFDFLRSAKIQTFYNDRTGKTIENAKQLLHRYDILHAGFNIDEGWYDCSNDSCVLKERGAKLGGHAVTICGYDQTGFYICNQWGTGWGAKGFAIMPYSVFLRQFMYGAYLYGYEI